MTPKYIKRHYEEIAEMLNKSFEFVEKWAASYFVLQVAQLFEKKNNPRFDKNRFLDTVEKRGNKIKFKLHKCKTCKGQSTDTWCRICNLTRNANLYQAILNRRIKP